MPTLPTPNHESLAAGIAVGRPVRHLADELGLSYNYCLTLARRPEVVQRALELAEERSDKVRQGWLVQEAEKLAFSDIRHYNVDENGKLTLEPDADDGVGGAVQSVKFKRRRIPSRDGGEPIEETETEIKLWDKPKALQLLMQKEGMLKQVVQAPDGGPPVRQVFKIGDTEVTM